MVIEKVFGICATTVSLSERFGSLGAMRRPRTAGMRRGRGALTNRKLIESLAMTLSEQKVRQRIKMLRGTGRGGLRRSGSEGSLFAVSTLRRSNSASSFGPGQFSRSGSYSNLSRAGSFGNLSQASGRTGGGAGRGRGRGARARRGHYVPRERFSNGGVLAPSYYRGVTRYGMMSVMQRVGMRRDVAGGGARGRGAMRGARGRGAMRGVRGRGAVRGVRGQARGAPDQMRGVGQRPQQKPIPTKEELDVQLDKYMACSKPALDRELEEYMKDAMEM